MLLEITERFNQWHVGEEPGQKAKHHRNSAETVHKEKTRGVHAGNVLEERADIKGKLSVNDLTGQKTQCGVRGKKTSQGGIDLEGKKYQC